MYNKFNDFLFREFSKKEKEIWSSTLLQSGVLFILLLIGSSVLQFSTEMFDGFKRWDLVLLSLVVGYGYFVLMVACKSVLYTEKNINKNRFSTCVCLSFVTIMLIIANFIYWRLDAFLYDPQRKHFGIVIFSGSLVIIFYTISTWISIVKVRIKKASS